MIPQSFLSFPKAQVFTPQSLPQQPKQPVAVLSKDRADEEVLQQYAERFPGLLLVQEVWKEIIPTAPLLISSAICGGDLKERFMQAASDRPCWLLIEPVRHKFSLPCPDAKGEVLSAMPETEGFFSEALCCRYAHFPGFALLWDTEQTLARKLQLAQSAGFCGYVVP